MPVQDPDAENILESGLQPFQSANKFAPPFSGNLVNQFTTTRWRWTDVDILRLVNPPPSGANQYFTITAQDSAGAVKPVFTTNPAINGKSGVWQTGNGTSGIDTWPYIKLYPLQVTPNPNDNILDAITITISAFSSTYGNQRNGFQKTGETYVYKTWVSTTFTL